MTIVSNFLSYYEGAILELVGLGWKAEGPVDLHLEASQGGPGGGGEAGQGDVTPRY